LRNTRIQPGQVTAKKFTEDESKTTQLLGLLGKTRQRGKEQWSDNSRWSNSEL